MILCEVCLLACAAALCIQSIWTDLRAGQIKNKYLLFWLAASILLNSVYYTFYARASFQAAAWNLALSALVSVGFYAIHIWSAGDSKLMVVLLSLLPGRLCWAGAETVFPAAYLFLALFSIGYLYLVGEALWLDFRSHAIRWPSPSRAAVFQTVREYLRVWVILYAWNCILGTLFPAFVEENVVLASLLSYFLITVLRERPLYHAKAFLVVCAAVDLFFLVWTWNGIQPERILRMAQTLALVLVMMWATWIAGKYVYQEIPTDQVKAGMILSRSTLVLLLPSKVKGLPKESFEDLRSRLSEEEAAAVRRWKTSKYGRDAVMIVRKIPFAACIAAGTLLFTVGHLFVWFGLWGV